MAGEEKPTLTPQEIRELLINVRQTQADIASLKETVKDTHRIVAGNGRYDESLVGRMQILEERHKVGITKHDNKQDEICTRLSHIEALLVEHSGYLEKNHGRIAELEESDDEKEKRVGMLEKIVEATRNKAIGIGIGVGVGTSIGIFGVTRFFEWLSTVIQ